MNINGYELQLTCGSCPEQYDVFYNGDLLGYLRLRHGCFRVQYPYVGGEVIYEAWPKGNGLFESEEREYYLNEAVRAIDNHRKIIKIFH